MPSDLMARVRIHLEFLGYTISPLEGGPDIEVMHPGGFTFSLSATEDVVRFISYFATTKVEHPGCLKFINSLNLDARMVSFCKDAHNTLVCQGFFYGAYTTTKFSSFLNAWDHDMFKTLRHRADEFLTYIE